MSNGAPERCQAVVNVERRRPCNADDLCSSGGPAPRPLVRALGQNQAGVEELKASVVKITSKAPEGQPRTGTGFIVRVDGDLVYIATAAHVIAGDPKPQVAFYHDKRRPVAAEIGDWRPTTSRPASVLDRPRPGGSRDRSRRWVGVPEMLRGGEEILTIGFGQGAGEWGVIKGTVASVSGSDIRIDGRIDEGNSGGPILMNGSVAGMVTSTRQGFGVAKSGIVVQSTLRRMGYRNLRAATEVRQSRGPIGRAPPDCTLASGWTTARTSRAAATRPRCSHAFAGVYEADDRVRLQTHPHRPRSVQDDGHRVHQVENDDTIEVSQDGWDGCQVKTGPAESSAAVSDLTRPLAVDRSQLVAVVGSVQRGEQCEYSVLLVAVLCPPRLLGQVRGGRTESLRRQDHVQSPGGATADRHGLHRSCGRRSIYIATASHVVEGDPQPLVTFHHDKRRPVAAKIGDAGDRQRHGWSWLLDRPRPGDRREVKALGWIPGF